MYKILVRCQGKMFGIQESYLKEEDGTDVAFDDKRLAEIFADKLRNSRKNEVNTFIQYFVREEK